MSNCLELKEANFLDLRKDELSTSSFLTISLTYKIPELVLKSRSIDSIISEIFNNNELEKKLKEEIDKNIELDSNNLSPIDNIDIN